MRFLHPPRTSGRSIVNSWGLVAPEYIGHKPPKPDDGWSYGFTRNPWDRVVSLWHLAHKTEPVVSLEEWIVGGMQPDPSSGRRFGPHICLPTAAWLGKADWIGRFETRGEDLIELADTLNRDVPVLHQNKSEHRSTPSYHEHYTDRARALVAEKYAIDVALYGYSFD